jgi:Holliday junction resolvase RusA-like endonuclease
VLIRVGDRWQRGAVVRQGRTIIDVAYTTARAIRDAELLLGLTREAVRRGLDPLELAWWHQLASDGVDPLVTVASGRPADLMVRHSGTPWGPLCAPDGPGATRVSPDDSERPAGRSELAVGSVVEFVDMHTFLASRQAPVGSLVSFGGPGVYAVGAPDGGVPRLSVVDVATPALDPGADLEIVRCWVPDTPRPKGSLKPIASRTGGGRVKVAMVEQSRGSKPWRAACQRALRTAYPQTAPTELPVELEVVFVVDRPKSSQLTEVTDPHVGDLDKLIRNISDAAEGSGVLANDRQIVAITSARKVWAPATHPEGAWIILREAR